MTHIPTIVLVLRSGGDFTFQDVELLSYHIKAKWKSTIRPRIICLWDSASDEYNIGSLKIIPLTSKDPGTWSRIQLYSPEMEQYRPFLYVDLDTAVISSLEEIFKLVGYSSSAFITLEDFWQRGTLATGLMWMPKDNAMIKKIWQSYKAPTGKRMDRYIRNLIGNPDYFWQTLTKKIYDFKPKSRQLMNSLPSDANIVCFHGHPRIFEATNIKWVDDYVDEAFTKQHLPDIPVTVIIPYNKDRGWLKDAIASVPEGVQLLLSQGDGNWPANFNKVLSQADRKYVRWLHEDDMLTEECIVDSLLALESQDVDFIHGNAYEIYMNIGRTPGQYRPPIQVPTLRDMVMKNVIHSATLMYKREVFEKVGPMDESLNTAEEFEFNCRCLKAGLKIGYCNSFLAWYRRHALQKVRTVNKQDKDREREMVRNNYR